MTKQHPAFKFFIMGFLLVYLVTNYYIYHTIVQGFNLTGIPLFIISFIFIFLSGVYILSWFLRGRSSVPIVSYLGASWMGFLAISFTVFVSVDIINRVYPMERDLFIISFLTIILLIFISVTKVLTGPKVKTVNIKQRKAVKEPLIIVHLSDVHLGLLTSERWLDRVVNKVNNLQADLIVITGDLVDDSFAKLKRFVPIMKKLNGKHGVFAVAGNHEYYSGITNFHQFCEAANIRVLHNEAITIDGKINLIGLSDEVTKSTKTFQSHLQEILNSCNLELYNILLVHQPVGFKQTAAMGIDLQLSGHTHRGQLPPMNILVNLNYRYAYGLHTCGDSHIYTTSGTGTWGPPMRLFSDSEIVMIKYV
ncbi:MAG: metallophosphoesterase [Clostridia bacterium]|nr:metallophosphoesterase [Clostridia bacterium]